MRTPLVVITGVDPEAMDSAALALAWDLPDAVAVQHRIDPESQVLSRLVSDVTGVLEREEVQLEHACVSCALREDILPTLERLARDGRWGAIISSLPVGAEAGNLAGALARHGRLARHLRLTNIVTSLGLGGLERDLTGDDLLRERGLHSNPWDGRGVAEVACAMIEYADLVTLTSAPGPAETGPVDLVRALVRPGTLLVPGTEHLDRATVLEARHHHARTLAWASPRRTIPLPALGGSGAWRIELSSPRPFHPERLVDQIERLGSGAHRSRGCFWIPTRPGTALAWDGAGGQLSLGTHAPWGAEAPHTTLVFTGLGERPADLVAAFEDLLLTPQEARAQGLRWRVAFDGLEPWLGDIEEVA